MNLMMAILGHSDAQPRALLTICLNIIFSFSPVHFLAAAPLGFFGSCCSHQ
jgi:hypothetical protein